MSRSAGGNEALAIFNAVVGNMLGVVVTPPLLLLCGKVTFLTLPLSERHAWDGGWRLARVVAAREW